MRAFDREVLQQVAEREEEVATRPVPRRPWERRAWEDEMEYGPIYAPADWWGDGESIPEHARVRYLRALHRLEAAGLIEVATVAGRLRHVRLTPAGQSALESWNSVNTDAGGDKSFNTAVTADR